eukprot:TRINITY_DN12050_c0_g1_i3.p2 TRINITY_DN12050_c0_g1~~TRINITY_DN12050_c0_g1_i3.p2  ORF type:complete len:136 (-),score=32.98 TRINITY_DN12050_c0_g1_i3:1378-1785(-)
MSDVAKEYAAGLAAGVATVIIGHPFDTVKVKLQKHNTEAHGVKYKNALHCTARILSSEGVRGLYRGATPSFVGMAFESSLLFGFYSQMKQSLQVPKVSLYLVHISGLYMGTNLLELQWASSLAKEKCTVVGHSFR